MFLVVCLEGFLSVCKETSVIEQAFHFSFVSIINPTFSLSLLIPFSLLMLILPMFHHAHDKHNKDAIRLGIDTDLPTPDIGC